MTRVSLTVNGSVLSADVEPRTHLADLLRETHNLTGTHIGCEHGVCGACTLLVDGMPIRSCITFAVACENATVTTIEGLDEDEIARELRAAFTAHHALQCGYCTPGMIVSARGVEALPGGGRQLLGPAGSGRASETRAAHAAAVGSAGVRAAPRLVGGGAGSRVDVHVGYTLPGLLAQFDIASRLTAALARNLEAHLSFDGAGAAAEPPPLVRELNAGSLITTVLLRRAKDFIRRTFGHA